MKANRTAIHKAGPDDTDRLVAMVTAFHAEEGIDTDEPHIRRAITPILEGSPHGEIFLAGPRMAPAGYALVCYGWSIEYGGLDAYLDELYLRPAVRGRGIGSDVLHALSGYLQEKGAGALALEVDFDNSDAIRTYQRSGFEARGRYGLMVRTLQ
ncbi:MAG: GNAT family N-acetyltransferase [Pseudomonadota bacterium]